MSTTPISEVFNEDCMVGMARYPDKFFDVAIADPPYGIGADGRRKYTGNLAKAANYVSFSRYDDQVPDSRYFTELERISKNQIIWGGNYFLDHLGATNCFIVWDKNNSGDFADCELAWTSFDSAVRKFKYTWNGMLQENMAQKERRIHPNHKPIALYKWLLAKYGNGGGASPRHTHGKPIQPDSGLRNGLQLHRLRNRFRLLYCWKQTLFGADRAGANV